MKDFHSRSGSALFIILLAIVAFTGLSYAVFKGGAASQIKVQDDHARMAAMDIIAYGDTMAKVAQKLILSNCTPLQFDYTNNVWIRVNGTAAVLTNSGAPSDGSCAAFGTAAQANPVKFPDIYTSRAQATTLVAGNIDPGSSTLYALAIPEIGTTKEEVIFSSEFLSVAVCMKINDILGVANVGERPPLMSSTNMARYSSSNVTDTVTMGDPDGVLSGKSVFCATTSTSEVWRTRFVRVLATR